MPEPPKEKLILRKIHAGMAVTTYEDQHGNSWQTCWTAGTLDENLCDECGENVGETLVCMDGGEAYCWECLERIFEVEYKENEK